MRPITLKSYRLGCPKHFSLGMTIPCSYCKDAENNQFTVVKMADKLTLQGVFSLFKPYLSCEIHFFGAFEKKIAKRFVFLT